MILKIVKYCVAISVYDIYVLILAYFLWINELFQITGLDFGNIGWLNIWLHVVGWCSYSQLNYMGFRLFIGNANIIIEFRSAFGLPLSVKALT